MLDGVSNVLNSLHAVSSSSRQVYPSEYAYHDDSINRYESDSTNCRRYPAGNDPGGVHTEEYIHCDGTQLKLTDSNFGQEQYQSTDYYVWSSRSGEQLLFIFPTAVSLTTIKLHYYSDSDQGLPRLRFYAVPDDFDVWNVPITSYPHVSVASVPPGGEPAGHRNISINVNFNTRKVLTYKYGSSFHFAVSEVEFLRCSKLDIIGLYQYACVKLHAMITPHACTLIHSRITDDYTYTYRKSNTTIS